MLPFTNKRLPVNTNSTYIICFQISPWKYSLLLCAKRKQNKRKKKSKQDNFRDRKI